MDQFDTQIRIMQQSNAMQETIQDLYRWEKEMKQKENLSHQTAGTSEVSFTVPSAKKKNQFLISKFLDRRYIFFRPLKQSLSQSFESEFPIRSHVTPANYSQPSTSKNATKNGPSSTKTPVAIVKTPSTLEKANEFKTRGNDCVKAGQFQKAIHYYTEAIRLNKFDAVYFSNRAHCYLKMNRYLECVEDCTIAIGLDDKCVKAYYRRMQAHENLDGNLTAALSDCESVLRFEPKNFEAKKCLIRIKAALKEQNPAPSAVVVTKSQIEHENVLLRASNGGGPAAGGPGAGAPSIQTTAATWSKYDGQNDYERIDFISKPPHVRSKQSLKRIKISETFSSMANGGGDRPLIEEIKSISSAKTDGDATEMPEIPKSVQPEPVDDITSETSTLSALTGPSGDTTNAIESKDVKIDASAAKPPPPTPKSTAQFHKIWLATNTDEQKYAILKVNAF